MLGDEWDLRSRPVYEPQWESERKAMSETCGLVPRANRPKTDRKAMGESRELGHVYECVGSAC
jgi:hypothetical protein